jgi:hypothetical protein
MCRGCIRNTHQENPFHKLQRWTGTHFRAAELWEVGTYILVPHYSGQRHCSILKFHRKHLEEFEKQQDEAEQVQLRSACHSAPTGPTPGSGVDMDSAENYQDEDGMQGVEEGDHYIAPEMCDLLDDAAFDRYLDNLSQREADDLDLGSHADDDLNGFPEYLPETSTVWAEPDDIDAASEYATEGNSGAEKGHRGAEDRHYGSEELNHGAEGYERQIPRADAFNNQYVRIVHTNGVHHLAMVSCVCHGPELLPLDLVACRLMPASFVHIRTLFSVQLLDLFRLCNLELKASAYQFYQLIRRLTRPMDPAGVVDLYNEFRRMSRLWRWMKKLKWAGVGNNAKTAADVKSGELANYCPACPQPHINLPENWKDDPNRYHLLLIIL